MTIATAMRVSGNGQVSLPAPVRRRWGTGRVLVLDLQDTVMVRPLPDDPAEDLEAVVGKYRGGPSVDELREAAFTEDAALEDRWG